jgi:cell division protein FtsN
MESENRRIVWIGGILILGIAGVLGWLLWNRSQTPEPIQQAVQPDTTLNNLMAPAPDTTLQEPPPQSSPQVVMEDGKYTVQVSSWRTRRRADQDAERFAEKGFNAYVQQAYIPSLDGTWYRVRVGSYATLAEARETAAQLAGLLESGFWLDRYQKDEPGQ